MAKKKATSTTPTHEIVFWCTQESMMLHKLVNSANKDMECEACNKKLHINFSECTFVKEKKHTMRVVSELGKEI